MSYKKQDHYYKKAKKEGYRARSSFKLQQIQKKFHIFRRGNVVIDFGAAPGAWTQVASEFIGKKGRIVAIDRNPIRPFKESNIITLQMDIRAVDRLLEFLEDKVEGKVDVCLSDLAGNTSGAWDLDSERQIYLASMAFEVSRQVLKKGGIFVTKVFRGATLKEFENELKPHFEMIKHWRPPATRKSSAEEFIICKGYLGPKDQEEKD